MDLITPSNENVANVTDIVESAPSLGLDAKSSTTIASKNLHPLLWEGERSKLFFVPHIRPKVILYSRQGTYYLIHLFLSEVSFSGSTLYNYVDYTQGAPGRWSVSRLSHM